MKNLRVTPHVAQNHERCGGSAIDGRTTRHLGYAVSQRKRKRIEECFGWLKTIALIGNVRHRGVCKVHWIRLADTQNTENLTLRLAKGEKQKAKQLPNHFFRSLLELFLGTLSD